jgi:hypothetical protein
MKKIVIVVLAAVLAFTGAWAQDADPNLDLNMSPPAIVVNATATLEATASNFGSTDVVANSLQVQISIGMNGEIMGLAAGSNPNWTVVSGPTGIGNTYRLRNTGGTLASFQQDVILLTVRGASLGGPSNVNGNITYIVGPNPLLGGAPSATQGNTDNTNDNPITSLTVTVPLPVTLGDFGGIVKECDALLSWKTLSEEKFSRFEVEYSADGRKFNKVGSVTANNSATGGTYQFTYAQPVGRAHYRLKLVDIDGNINYSKSILIVSKCLEPKVTIYPNPVTANQDANVVLKNFGNLAYGVLFDAAGKQVQVIKLTNGVNRVRLIAQAGGNYVLKINDMDGNKASLTITVAR